ncbi:MAG: hypothetical protein WCI20_13670 [bacterium]
MKRILGRALMVIVLSVMAGCMSTPESRIKKEPGVFAAFPPDIQSKVQRGEVAIGFTKDMVRLALGLPRRVNTRITEGGQTEIWVYTGTRYISRYEPVYAGYWYRDRAGRMCRSTDTVWMNHGYSEEYPVLRLEFAGNSLKAIERMQR